MINNEAYLLHSVLCYEDGHCRRTQHILKVYALAKLLGEQEKISVEEQQILQAAAGYVKPGGILLMSTCTITLEENHLNLKWFLQQFPEFDLCSLNEQIPNAPEEGFWQIWPQREKKEHLDGFFMARLRKNE